MSPLLTSFPENHRVSSLVSTICPQGATWVLVHAPPTPQPPLFCIWIGAVFTFEFYGAATCHQLWCPSKNQVNYVHWLVHFKVAQCRNSLYKSLASNKRNCTIFKSFDLIFFLLIYEDRSGFGLWFNGRFTVPWCGESKILPTAQKYRLYFKGIKHSFLKRLFCCTIISSCDDYKTKTQQMRIVLKLIFTLVKMKNGSWYCFGWFLLVALIWGVGGVRWWWWWWGGWG